MTTKSDHFGINLRHWITGGFVVFAIIFLASYNPLGPRIDPGELCVGNVVVAKLEIPLGEEITADHVAVTRIPNGSAPEGGVFRSMDQVVGRVTITTIGFREPITSLKLAPAGVRAGLSAAIPEGHRAMTVKVDEVVGVKGFITPGSFVDVVVVIVPVQGDNGKDAIYKIVLQNIKVLASSTRIISPENQRRPSNVKAVTLEVTPEQAEKLVLATNEGKLQLVMRTTSESEVTRSQRRN